jgi:hypothetical protein
MDKKIRATNDKPLLFKEIEHDEHIPPPVTYNKDDQDHRVLKFGTSKMSPALNYTYRSRKLSNPLFHKLGDPILKMNPGHEIILGETKGDKSTMPEFKKLIA